MSPKSEQSEAITWTHLMIILEIPHADDIGVDYFQTALQILAGEIDARGEM